MRLPLILRPHASLLAAIAALCLCPSAFGYTAKQCTDERRIAVVIAGYRDKGVSETIVTAGAKQRFSDPDIRAPILNLIHTIYSSPAMKTLSPQQIGDAVAAVCLKQADATSPAPASAPKTSSDTAKTSHWVDFKKTYH